MPFKSKQQMKAMFAQGGKTAKVTASAGGAAWHGKRDDLWVQEF